MRKKLPIDFTPENSRLTFIKVTVKGWCNYKRPDEKSISAKALYKCSCGVIKEYFMGSVKSGAALSCGCYNLERLSERAVHGLSKHPLYRVWASVKARCTNSNEKSYKNYGGRGVKLCEEWRDNPEEFIKWGINNGWKKGLELDKDIKAREMGLEPPLVYSPQWCQFVTKRKNNEITRHSVLITFNGVEKTIIQWARDIGITPNTLQNRIRRYKWPIEKALTEPVNKLLSTRKKHEVLPICKAMA